MLVALLSLVSIEHTGSEAASSARAPERPSAKRVAHLARRRRDQSGAQNLDYVGPGDGQEGFSATVGNTSTSDVYRVNITATGPDDAEICRGRVQQPLPYRFRTRARMNWG